MNNPANPADMEEILSSIRSTLEEESGKVGKEGQVLPDGDAPAADDVLDLSEVQMVPDGAPAAAPAGSGEAMFDIDAFARGGQTRTLSPEEVAKVKGEDRMGEQDVVETVDVAKAEAAAVEKPAPAVEAEASDDFDRLLAELQDESGAPPKVEAVAPVTVAPVVSAPAVKPVAPATAVASAPVTAGGRMQLPVIPASTGLQVALPAEVLAEALRPLIKDWVAENLSGVVERLVAEEISKLVKE